MTLPTSIRLLLAGVLAVAACAPAYAGHHHGFHPRHHHHYYRHHHNDWGWYLGLSTLFVLPEIIRQSQYDDGNRYPQTYYAPYADRQRSLSVVPVNQAMALTTADKLDQRVNATTATTSSESVADEVLRVANNGTYADATASDFLSSSVRSLPANARVIQTDSGTEYEWQGQHYHYNWQTDMYEPLSH